MRFSIACLFLATVCLGSACGSSGSSTDTTGGATGPGTGGTGGNTAGPGAGGTSSCGDPSTFVVPDAPHPIYGIAVDDTSVYFGRGLDGVYKAPKSGGNPTMLAPTNGLHIIATILVDDASVYFADGDSILSVPKNGGASTKLATGMRMSDSIATDGTNIYFGDRGDPPGPQTATILKVPKTGGATTVLAMGHAEPDSFVVDGDTLYWNDGVVLDSKLDVIHSEGLFAVSTAGGKERTVVPGMAGKAGDPSGGWSLAVDDTYVYYSDVDIDAVSNAGMYRAKKDGSAMPERFADLGTASAFIESGFLYVANGNVIAKLSTADGSRTNLICFADATMGSITMTHDDKAFYFAKDDGSEMHSVKTAPR